MYLRLAFPGQEPVDEELCRIRMGWPIEDRDAAARAAGVEERLLSWDSTFFDWRSSPLELSQLSVYALKRPEWSDALHQPTVEEGSVVRKRHVRLWIGELSDPVRTHVTCPVGLCHDGKAGRFVERRVGHQTLPFWIEVIPWVGDRSCLLIADLLSVVEERLIGFDLNPVDENVLLELVAPVESVPRPLGHIHDFRVEQKRGRRARPQGVLRAPA